MMMLVLLWAALGRGGAVSGLGRGSLRRPLLMWVMRELTAGTLSTIVLMLCACEAVGSLA
jgi:hypothetical protein